MRTGDKKSYWFEGEQHGNFSLKDDSSVALGGRDSFDPAKGYLGVRIQQGVPVLDRDWNELEDIRRYQEILLRRYYLGDGTPDDGFKVTAAGGMGLSIASGRFLVDGLEVVSDAVDSLTISTPSTTPATVYVYLEATICEVTFDATTETDSDLDNHQDAGVETCIRHKVQWDVKATEDVNETESEWPYYRSLLATIAYNGSPITQDQIADSRARLHLLKTGDLGCQKVDGPLEIGDGAFLVGDLSKTLQVAFLDSAGTAFSSPYFTLSPDGAIIEGGLTANGDPSAASPILGLTANDGAIIEGGLTANGDSGTPSILGLTVNDGAIIYGGLTIHGGTLTLDGATISGGSLSGGSGSFTDGLTVSKSTGPALTVSNGASIGGGLTVSNGASIGGGLTVTGGATINDGLTIGGALAFQSGGYISTGLGVSGQIIANGGLYLPQTTHGSEPLMLQGNDVELQTSGGGGTWTSDGGEFYWVAEQLVDGSDPTLSHHNLCLYFNDVNVGGNYYVGYISASDGVYHPQSSDEKYKTNVATLDDVLHKMDQIRGVFFDWNDLYKASHYGASTKRQIGMIAQEVQAVFPELVEEVTMRDMKFLGLDYQKFTAVLVQAVKELKAMNESLSDRVKALEAPTKTKAKKVTDNERPA